VRFGRRWSQRLVHPSHNCLDLALAKARNTRLLTQDERLHWRLERDPQAAGLVVALEAC
jgi:predicted nucleic acid-binding protein